MAKLLVFIIEEGLTSFSGMLYLEQIGSSVDSFHF